MKKLIFIFSLLLYHNKGSNAIAGFNTFFQMPTVVRDSTTAVKIAEAIWLPLFGEKIYNERPFIAKLIGDSVWQVRGSSSINTDTHVPGGNIITIYSGGVAYIKIRKSNCEILDVGHGK